MTQPIFAAMLLVEPILLGARTFRRRGGAGAGEMIVYLMIAAGLIAGVCLAVFFVSRANQRRRRYSHNGLFASLCLIHGLDHAAKALLKQVASCHKTSQPARVFTEPNWLDPGSLPAPLRGRAAQVAALRSRLFAQSASK